MREYTASFQKRFWTKVDKGDPSGCWLWTASLKPAGYGQIQAGKRGEGVLYAHRVAYELTVGEIPEGYVLDHTCHKRLLCTEDPCVHRRCVNPCHLKAVTEKENILRGNGTSADNTRKTHCKRGHPLSGENLLTYTKARQCRTCVNDRKREYYRRSIINDKSNSIYKSGPRAP